MVNFYIFTNNYFDHFDHGIAGSKTMVICDICRYCVVINNNNNNKLWYFK